MPACIKHHQVAMSIASRAARAFKRTTRAVSTDAYAANICAEKSIASDRSKGDANTLHSLCDVHGTAGCYNKVFHPFDKYVSGIIHIALALRSGAAMVQFRRCLREEIASRLEIIQGSPPQEVVDYKKQIVRLFVNHGNAVHTRRALLAICPNGDWRAENVQYYVPIVGGDFRADDKSGILEFLTHGLTSALASSQPAQYNRSRWTGSDIALDDLSIFEAVHKLLSTTMCRFAATFLTGQAARFHLDLGVSLARYEQGLAVAIADIPGGNESGDDGEEVEADADAPRDKPQPDDQQEKDLSWAQQNARHRRQSIEFLRLRPFAHMILMRWLMEPLRQYLSKQFDRASDKWERKQLSAVAKAVRDGRAPSRQYRITEVASGEDDKLFMRQVELMFSEARVWSI